MITNQPFTTKSALFIVMGGCAIFPSEIPELTKGHPLTLTIEGFLKLYNEGLITESDVNDSIVDDKSKSDGLAKTLVLIQASWLLVQCIGRFASRLPSTLLEIHTSIHVLCALGTYCLWWYKPQNVLRPILVLTSDQNRSLVHDCYFEFMRKRWPSESKDNVDPAAEYVGAGIAEPPANGFSDRWERFSLKCGTDARRGAKVLRCLYNGNLRDSWNETFWLANPINSKTFYKLSRSSVTNSPYSAPNSAEPFRIHQRFDINFCQTRAAMGSYVSVSSLTKISSPQLPTFFNFAKLKALLSGDTSSLKGSGSIMMQMVIWKVASYVVTVLLATLYGTLHVLAYKQHFPTEIEGLLWIISSIVSAVFFLFCFLLKNLLMLLIFTTVGIGKIPRFDFFEHPVVKVSLRFILFSVYFMVYSLYLVLFFILMVVFPIVFISSRVYLVVESFISLRSLHPDIFNTVPWSNYWPHF